MKKNFIAIMISIFSSTLIHAQTNFTGTWNGVLNIAGELHLVLHVTQLNDGTYSGKLDSPDQNVTGIVCDKVEGKTDAVGNSMLSFTIDKIKVSYSGKLVNDSLITGTFTQGINIPLDLHRSDIPFVAKQVNRPQTPKPPFPYKSEEVVYSRNGLQYGGTLTIPNGNGNFPAILLITGSGQQDRDETIFNHKPFAVIADALTKDGFIVLRVDDRGIGNSTGDFSASTTADFSNDVNASVEYLKSRKEVNDKKIGLLGHSEGGMIAPMVASQRKDIDFIILLAGPGVKITELMTEQNKSVIESTGIPAPVAEKFKTVYSNITAAIINAPDSAAATANAMQVLNDWAAKTDTTTLHLLGFNKPGDKELYLKQIMSVYASTWFKYFIQFDPHPYLTDLKKIKVLALNGSRDIQVVSQQNLPAIQNALIEGRTKNFEVQELPGLNHLFQTCTKCTVMEYGQLEETISPVALQSITTWLNKNVK